MTHVWRTEADGVTPYYFEFGDFHGGPMCAACGHGFCQHCKDEWDTECDDPGVGSATQKEEQND